MNRFLLRSSLLVFTSVGFACTDDDPLPSASLELDASLVATDAGGDAGLTMIELPPDCAPLGSPLPKTLSCTGLYGAIGAGAVEKAVHPANREFMPGAQLWTDGADKRRWIALPEGAQIDTSDPNGWVFPNGTRIWKEFAFQGKRAETRFMYKIDDVWAFATYQWNETDTEAIAVVDGPDVPIPGGGAHAIPKVPDDCNTCHRGSRDKVLGFQHVLLGLPGASGLTLAALAAEGRLTQVPARTAFAIPDDGTGMSAQALSWMHANCGVSCHNETGNAIANMSKMFLRIDPSTLDDGSTANWNSVKMTVGVPSMTANFFGGVRIIPGSPDDSLIVQLAQTRGSSRAMPPLGTRIVDPQGIAVVREWITRLGGRYPGLDGGLAMDAGAALDPTASDADVPADAALAADAGSAEAERFDATTPAGLDAGVPAAIEL